MYIYIESERARGRENTYWLPIGSLLAPYCPPITYLSSRGIMFSTPQGRAHGTFLDAPRSRACTGSYAARHGPVQIRMPWPRFCLGHAPLAALVPWPFSLDPNWNWVARTSPMWVGPGAATVPWPRWLTDAPEGQTAVDAMHMCTILQSCILQSYPVMHYCTYMSISEHQNI